jgi:hypothetical protein
MVATLIATGACSTLQPPDPNGPRSNAPPYPVLLLDEGTRQEEALLAWRQLAQRYGVSNQAEISLNPLTATINALPGNATPIVLPKVGTGSTQTEEENRESLRRFIDEWRSVIGAEPNELSLVERADESANVKRAHYEQRPFRYALRGGYGDLIIRFNNNRQILELSSNCIRNTERLQTTLSNLKPNVTAEEAVSHVRGKTFIISTVRGQQSFTLSANEPAEAKQLVIYALPSKVKTNLLELRLAWEIETPNATVKRVYLDAVSDEVIAAT